MRSGDGITLNAEQRQAVSDALWAPVSQACDGIIAACKDRATSERAILGMLARWAHLSVTHENVKPDAQRSYGSASYWLDDALKPWRNVYATCEDCES